MALFKVLKGNRSALDSQVLHDGYAYFCVDDGSFHIDYADLDGILKRKQISAEFADRLRYRDGDTTIEIDPSELLTAGNYEEIIGTATTEKNGLMSKEDKLRLDTIEENIEFITTDDIDAICGATIRLASEVEF